MDDVSAISGHYFVDKTGNECGTVLAFRLDIMVLMDNLIARNIMTLIDAVFTRRTMHRNISIVCETTGVK